MPKDGLLPQLFFSEPAGRFALGHVFSLAEGFRDSIPAADGIGHWRCDITDRNRLTWSDEVYELFGIPVGTKVKREDAVAHYSDYSKSVLDRLRAFALGHKCGFILDASISPGGAAGQWIRVVAVPILEAGQIVGLQGWKRAL